MGSHLHSRVRLSAWVALALSVACFTVPAVADVRPDDVVGSSRVLGSVAVLEKLAPDVEVPAGILVSGSGRVLWERSADDPRPMASTTKIMTALLVSRLADSDEVVTMSAAAASVGGSGVYFRAGEQLTVDELLRALLMSSSNAAAHALAEHVSGTVDSFVALMNLEAEELGLEDTRFENPHGLHSEGHESSARDLVVLAQTALADERIAEIVATGYDVISGPGGERVLENSNDLLSTYRGAFGVKTGWTDPAGYCLVAAAERDEIVLYAVVLGAAEEGARFSEAAGLLDWGFSHLQIRDIISMEETPASVVVVDYLDVEVILSPLRDITLEILDTEGSVTRGWEVSADTEAPVVAGEQLGTMSVYQGSEVLTTVPLVAVDDVPEPDLWETLRVFLVRLWWRITGQMDTVGA